MSRLARLSAGTTAAFASLLFVLVGLSGCAKGGSDGSGAAGGGDANAPQVKVGLVFDVGGRGDQSFNDAAYKGLERAMSELHVPKANIEYIEPGEGGDRESALRQLAAGPYDVIFGLSLIHI